MLRSLFFAAGTFLLLCGLVLFRVDAIVLAPAESHADIGLRVAARTGHDGRDEVDPPPWLSYTLTSTGVVTMLYALALPRKA